MKERRKHFFIDKPLQFRYAVYIILPLLVVSTITMISLYLGVWGSVLDAFSDEKIRNDLLIASRLTEYEEARIPFRQDETASPLAFFKQTEKLSQRQREVFRDILDETNRKLIAKFIFLLVFIAWGSIYLSHKIAGPIYRFNMTLQEIEKGNLRTRIRLRKADEAQLLGDRFNKTLESLDLKVALIKNIIREHESEPQKMVARLKEELGKIQTSADR